MYYKTFEYSELSLALAIDQINYLIDFN